MCVYIYIYKIIIYSSTKTGLYIKTKFVISLLHIYLIWYMCNAYDVHKYVCTNLCHYMYLYVKFYV